jgi:uncharacterized repeat protein (TIGR03803 family)
MRKLFVTLLITYSLSLFPHLCQAQYTNLVDFNGIANGHSPNGDLLLSGTTLYGMTQGGGANNSGCIFSFNTTSNIYKDLFNFNGTDGQTPMGDVILSGTTLYGMTAGGGANGDGCVFSFNTSGNIYTDLFDFNGTNGADPDGSLILSGTTLYGMTAYGGANNVGCVFSLNTIGNIYTDLLDFNGANGNGPYGSLILSGTTLYGMTAFGGVNGDGCVFSFNTIGNIYTDLLDFNGTNGAGPYGSLILSGTTLYGMTAFGGVNGDGNIFSFNTVGDIYTDLLDFNGTNGSNPQGSLILSGTTLYGMTNQGEANLAGCVFSFNTSSLVYTDMLDFGGSNTNGAYPYGSLTLSGNTFYGMTYGGGGNNAGVVFSLSAPQITIASRQNETCSGGNTGSATANPAAGGTAPYTYNWTPSGGTNLSATGLSAGTYTLTVTDANSLTASAPVFIYPPVMTFSFSTENAVQNWTVPASITQVTITAGGASGEGSRGVVNNGASLTAACAVTPGDNISVVVGGMGNGSRLGNGPGGGGGTFVYDSNTITLLLVGGGGGGDDYSVANTGAQGGTDIIHNTTVTAGGTDTSATGGTGGTGGSAESSIDGSGGAGAGAGWLSNGANFTGGNPAFGGQDRANFFLGGAAQTSDVNSGGYGGGGGGGLDCGGGGGGYNGGGGGNDFGGASRGGGGGGASYLVSTATVVVSPVANDTLNGYVIISYAIPNLAVTISNQNNVLCNGGMGTITANAATGGFSPYTYLWSDANSQTSLNATGLSAGTYTITVSDNHGCTSTASATITQPNPLVVAQDSVNDNSSCNGVADVTPSGGTPPYTYLWTTGHQTTDTIKSQCAGTYCCIVTDNNGCSLTNCVTINLTTSTESIFNGNNITIYPDPNSGYFTLAGIMPGQVMELYNYTGQKQRTIIADKSTMLFDISDMADGLYLIRILNGDGTLAAERKIIKME